MGNFQDNIFAKLTSMLQSNKSQDVDKLLNALGISKEEALNKIKSIDQQDVIKTLSSKEFSDFMQNLSPQDIESIKNTNIQSKDAIENILKKMKEKKEGN